MIVCDVHLCSLIRFQAKSKIKFEIKQGSLVESVMRRTQEDMGGEDSWSNVEVKLSVR